MKLNFEVKYLNYTLKNPIIIGSSSLTASAENIKILAQNNAAAVVLKSIYEEQIMIEKFGMKSKEIGKQAYEAFKEFSKNYSANKYPDLIKECKKQTDIPIIASIITSGKYNWYKYTTILEEAGADALEINFALLPYDEAMECIELEKILFEMLKTIRKQTKLPIVIKLSFYGLNLTHIIKRIAVEKLADAVVLFNRFYNPDIDTDNMEFISKNILSFIEENMPSLRWIAALYNRIKIPFIASSGIFSGKDIVKQILVGATAVEVVSAIYKLGEGYINTMLNQIRDWMIAKEYKKLNDFRGIMSFEKTEDVNLFEKLEFLKYFSNY